MNNEELQEKFEQLASSIDWIKTKLVDLQEEKGLAPVKTRYKVEVPEDIEDYYYVDKLGRIYLVRGIIDFDEYEYELLYKRGLAFKTRAETERYDRERILLFKMHKWAEEHNGGWKPDWKDFDEYKYSVTFDFDDYEFLIKDSWYENAFSKLPYFISEGIAEQFIKEFEKEIKEVLC